MAHNYTLNLKFGKDFPQELKDAVIKKAQENLDARPAANEEEVYQRVMAVIEEYFPEINARRFSNQGNSATVAPSTEQTEVSMDDLVARLRSLEEFARNGWQLPTSELAERLQLKPQNLKGKTIERYGFKFIRQAKRQGNESLWSIEKCSGELE